MTWHVRVTGSGVVAADRGDGREIQIPHGKYSMSKRPDGRYEITGQTGSYMLVAPDRIGADTYVAQKIEDGTLQILMWDWP